MSCIKFLYIIIKIIHVSLQSLSLININLILTQ